jgi:hypothetical protein
MTYFLFTGLDIQMTHILIEFWMNLKLKVVYKHLYKDLRIPTENVNELKYKLV